MCREFYGQDDLERPELFNQIFQIVVMGAESSRDTQEWFEDFAMYQLFCNKTFSQAKQAASTALMIRDACISHRCEQNQVYRRDPQTGEGRCVCRPGRVCSTDDSQSVVGIVLAGLILVVLFLLWLTTLWTLLRNTHIDQTHIS